MEATLIARANIRYRRSPAQSPDRRECRSWPEMDITAVAHRDTILVMSYDVHITRRKDWFDREQPGITLEDWSAYVNSDVSMRLDGVARTTSPSGDVIEMKSPGLAVWTAYSGHDEGRTAWFNLSPRGNISVKDPDPEILGKMWKIAQTLSAKVQGDDGEIYDADGSFERVN